MKRLLLKKITSVLLCALFIFSEFTLVSFASGSSDIPELGEQFGYNDFDGNALNDNRVSLYNNDVVVKDSFLNIDERSSSNGAIIYINEDKKSISDDFYSELVLKKAENTGNVFIRFYGSKSEEAISARWSASGIGFNDQKNPGTYTFYIPSSEMGDECRLGFYINPKTKVYSVWFDGKKVIDEHGFLKDSDNISNVTIYMNGKSTDPKGELGIGSYSFYNIAKTDSEKLADDMAALTRESLLSAPLAGEYLLDSFRLPSVGANGSTISWTIEDPHSVVDDDGTVTRPVKTDASVRLKALVTNGALSDESEWFEYTVAALRTEILSLPKLSSMSLSNEFTGESINDTCVAPIGNGFNVSDGFLNISGLSSSNSGVTVYTMPDKKVSENEFYSEFVLRRITEKGNVFIRLENSETGENAISGRWNSQSVGFVLKENLNDFYTVAKLGTDYNDVLKLGIYVNHDTGRYTVWVNNKEVLNTELVRDIGGSSHMKFYMNSGSQDYGFRVESYRTYNIWKDMSDNERVTKDAESLTIQKLLNANTIGENVIDSSLKLPLVGEFGSDISWSSSDDSIIQTDGTVIRQPGDSFSKVTMTAVITYGDADSKQVNFDFKVLDIDTYIDPDVAVKDIIWENDFNEPETDDIGMEYNSMDKNSIRSWRDGRYYVERTSGSLNMSDNSTIFYASDISDKNSHTGLLGIEFTVGKENAPSGLPLHMTIVDKAWRECIGLFWNHSNVVWLTYRESADTTEQKTVNLDNDTSPNELKVLIMVDTDKGSYDLWLNDKLYLENKYVRDINAKSFLYMNMYCDKNIARYGSYYIDDFKVYNAIPPTMKRIEYDLKNLTSESILTKPTVFENYVNSDFNLYTSMDYGSKIVWESSNPDVVNPETGEITRPVDVDYDIPVTLTANLINGVSEASVSFDFVVLRDASDETGKISGDAEYLTYPVITSVNPDEIKESLNLISEGIVFGSDITWTSSAPDIIASSGRVTRPRWDESPAVVTLTAVIGDTLTKDFEFTVLPDVMPTDPMVTSDEDFFGVYKDGEWTNKGMLSYDEFPKLSGVQDAVKLGDYSKAKEEFLYYMRDKAENDNSPRDGRIKGYADYVITGCAEDTGNLYYVNSGSAESDEYSEIEIDLGSRSGIKAGYLKSYNIISRYNDSVELKIAGSDYPVESMRPVLILNVNDSPRRFYAVDSAVIRAGRYKDTVCDIRSELTVKMQGEFLGDETCRSLLKFDLRDLSETDKITSAKLVLYAKKSNNYSEPKEFFVMHDPYTSWDSETVTWFDVPGLFYNFNGLDGGKKWIDIAGSDTEYYNKNVRFERYMNVGAEYLYTKDEKYAYTTINDMLDLMSEQDTLKPRPLDSMITMSVWTTVFKSVVGSRYMSPELCTAIVKRLFRQVSDLAYVSEDLLFGNGAITNQQNVFEVCSYFTEFTKSEEFRQHSLDWFNERMGLDYYSDGAYSEDTGSYHETVFKEYIAMREFMYENNIQPSDDFNNLVHRATYYSLLFMGPNKEAFGYGDEVPAKDRGYNRFSSISDIYNDRELQYIDSGGSKGVEPDWTSTYLPESQYVFLRSDWTKDAHMLFTNVRNGALIHGHPDDNGIILFGYGKNLLTDSGYVNYDDSPERQKAISTLNHNTVEIDGQNQEPVVGYVHTKEGTGTTNAFIANQNFDFVSQTSDGYEYIGNKHRRTITFIKPDFYIVSDLMTPDDKTGTHTYKQSWHMVPTSGLYTKDGKIYSDYSDDGNLIIADADNNTLYDYEGIYTLAYGEGTPAPGAYYEKKSAGDVTFDTVLFPYKGTDAKLDVERIDMGVDSSEATALRISSEKEGNSFTAYYMLEYTDNGERIFGKYKTDADMAVVIEDKNGNPVEFIMNNGSYIKSVDGSVYVDTDSSVNDIDVEISGTELNITTTVSDFDISNTELKLSNPTEILRLNGQSKEFTESNGTIIPSDADKAEILENDKNPGMGIVDKPSSGGAGGSGGVGGTGGTVTPVVPDTKLPFTDISGHWASDNIVSANASGIINGYPDSTFIPDNDITRAEFLTVVCRSIELEPKEYNGEFADVSSADWYAGTISAALKAGIISKDINFRPNDSITRQEMCKILAIALKLNRNMGIVPADYVPSYTDTDAVSEWAREYVNFVSYHKIMGGMTDGSFAPQKNATRAEAATVMVRSLNNEK